jgi:hypothetical protein
MDVFRSLDGGTGKPLQHATGRHQYSSSRYTDVLAGCDFNGVWWVSPSCSRCGRSPRATGSANGGRIIARGHDQHPQGEYQSVAILFHAPGQVALVAAQRIGMKLSGMALMPIDDRPMASTGISMLHFKTFGSGDDGAISSIASQMLFAFPLGRILPPLRGDCSGSRCLSLRTDSEPAAAHPPSQPRGPSASRSRQGRVVLQASDRRPAPSSRVVIQASPSPAPARTAATRSPRPQR